MNQKTIIMIKRLISISSVSIVFSVFSAGCSSVVGNIIPASGPTMESIYDDVDLGDDDSAVAINSTAQIADSSLLVAETRPGTNILPHQGPSGVASSPTFFALDNPELTLYVFPHLAGSELLPIPGYWTVFPAYPRNYYALPLLINDHHGEKTPS